MKIWGRVVVALVLLAMAGWFLVSTRSTKPRNTKPAQPAATNANPTIEPTGTMLGASAKSSSSTNSLIGETILRGYGSAASTPENDLTLISHLMDNFSLLVKSAADRPLSANEDWAAAFRGLNAAHERFLPDHHVALDAQGRLIDRWATPLFFHALGNRRFDVRSAGPDKKLWTADDVHRNADGSFLRGAALNPASLMDATVPRARGIR